jgi:DNA polymerase-3 subunit delta'
VVSTSPRPPLPWLDAVLEQALAMRRAHALLLHGAAGDGLFDAAQAITRAWLCDAVAQGAPRACGSCGGCHLVALNQHPDLHALVPEDLRPTLGLQPGAADAGGEVEAADGGGRAKRKPSRQIRVGEVRAAIDWIVTSSSRGGAKVVLIHPAEAMNVQAANALLKTLEEPPRGARLLLTAAQPSQLLPTVLSRCQVLPLRSPAPDVARSWLQEQGLDQPEVLLAACSNRPLDALAMAAAGIDATRWRGVPEAVLARQAQAFSGWGLAQLFDALQKLCHDGLALAAGGAPRFFPAQALSAPVSIEAMAAWSKDLSQRARRIDHPWNEGLLIDALLLEAQAAWSGSARPSDTLIA